ncbi:MAG: hypothetical protein NVS3B3_17100 [Aquirhabdus sp.]
MTVPFDATTCRGTLADYVEAGVSDRRIIDLLKSGDQFLPIECELLDYKEKLPDDSIGIAKIIRHIIAFHNTFGGYLIFGIAETVAETQFDLVGCGRSTEFDLKQLKDRIYSYAGVHIALSIWDQTLDETNVVGLFVPKRIGATPVFFGKEGPQDKGKAIFKKGDIYVRRGDNSEPAAGDSMAFLFGDRDCYYSFKTFEKIKSKVSVFEHNLPDRNFVCPKFIGRTKVIEKLWMWFADQFSYVRVLAGEGGLGKTSIAYEFATQICANAPMDMERLLWVTAKTKQFSGERDQYIPVPQTHFNSYISLLETLCSESAIPSEQIEGSDDNLLKRFLKDALQILPTLVIIDDVDSLTSDDQKRVLELAMQLASTKSRFLLTTRKNMTYSPDIAIEIEGFKDHEYCDYIELLQERFHGPAIKEKDIDSLQLVTHGSPLFTDSLYRLIRQGSTVKQATAEWKGKKGAEARAAALLVEIRSLSNESKRVLLAVSLLKSCSRTELSQACKYVDETLNDCLQELSAVYLISAPRIGNEPRYEVLETMFNLVIQIKDQLVPGAANFEKEVLDLRKNGLTGKSLNKTALVGNAISEASAFLRNGEVDEALKTVSAAQKRSAYHADLYLMQGKCLMSGEKPRSAEARTAFSKAYQGGVRKPMLFDLWYQSEMDMGHSVGAVTVSDLALDEKINRDGYWEVRKGVALVGVAKDQEKAGYIEAAIKELTAAATLTFASLDVLPPQEQFPIKESLFAINDYIFKLSRRGEQNMLHNVDMVNVVAKMTERMDYRRITLSNLVQFLEFALSASNRRHGKFSKETFELQDQARIIVLRVLKTAMKVRAGDQDFVSDLVAKAENA